GLFSAAAFATVLVCQWSSSVDWPADDEARRTAVLEKQIRYYLWNSEQRERVTQEVTAGSVSLLEAAARCAAVGAQRPADVPPGYAPYPGDTVEEKICRHVIRHVECSLRHQPQEQAAVLQRLEAELNTHLSNGSLRLPDLPSGKVA